MKSGAEFYYVPLESHGPEEMYRPLYELLKELRAGRVGGGFPVWAFSGEADSHNVYQERFHRLLPRTSADRPDIRYGLLLMSARGRAAHGKCAPGG